MWKHFSLCLHILSKVLIQSPQTTTSPIWKHTRSNSTQFDKKFDFKQFLFSEYRGLSGQSQGGVKVRTGQAVDDIYIANFPFLPWGKEDSIVRQLQFRAMRITGHQFMSFKSCHVKCHDLTEQQLDLTMTWQLLWLVLVSFMTWLDSKDLVEHQPQNHEVVGSSSTMDNVFQMFVPPSTNAVGTELS